MSFQEAVQQIQHAPLTERIRAIELLLQSLKNEIVQSEPMQAVRKPFRIRTFNLGTDIQMDREEMYADRVI